MTDRDVEKWENQTRGLIFVNKFAGNGIDTKAECVRPGRSVLLTTQERELLNTDRCYSAEVDVFQDGRMSPVILATTSDDLREKSNPNHMGETEALALFKLQWKSFEKKVRAISSTPLLNRMITAAKASESSDEESGVNVTMRQMNVLEDHLSSLLKDDNITEVETVASIGGVIDMDR